MSAQMRHAVPVFRGWSAGTIGRTTIMAPAANRSTGAA